MNGKQKKTIEEYYWGMFDRLIKSDDINELLTIEDVRSSYIEKLHYYAMKGYRNDDRKYIEMNYNSKISFVEDGLMLNELYHIEGEENEDSTDFIEGEENEDSTDFIEGVSSGKIGERIAFSQDSGSVYIKEERDSEIRNLVKAIKNALTAEEYQILKLRYVDEISYDKIAIHLNTYKKDIERQLIKIKEKIMCFQKEAKRILKNEAPSKNSYGFTYLQHPYELLKNVGLGGYKVKGYYYWNKSECYLPEYFESCYKDQNTRCSLCYDIYGMENKCTRKPYFLDKLSQNSLQTI